MVISDHGFTNFRRGVNLNTWLRENGYLHLKPGHETSGDWFEHVDWSRTRAFTLGLTGLFVNLAGRERHGIVEKGPELERLCRELKTRLDTAVERARKAHRGDDAAEIKAAMEELTAAYQEAGRSLYSQAQSEAPSQEAPPSGDAGGTSAGGDGAAGGGGAKPDDVVEADYEIVDDKK